MGLSEQLERYRVTTVPAGARPELRLVWSAPEDEDALQATEAAVLPLLSAYRITRVPGRAAS